MKNKYFTKIRNLEIFILECLHKIKTSVFSVDNGQIADIPSERKGFSFVQETIKQIIATNKTIFIGRIGSIELNAFCNYLQINGLIKDVKFTPWNYLVDNCWPNWWSIGVKNGMRNNAGFFPASNQALDRWGG